MTEREKIIKVIKKAFEDCGRMLKEQIPRVLSGEIKKASDGTPPLDEAIADALIAAGIGDVTEWKERAKKHRVRVLPDGTIKQLYSAEEVEDINRQREEYKHRAEAAERVLLNACVNLIKDREDNVDMELLTRVVYTNYLRKAEKELQKERKDV